MRARQFSTAVAGILLIVMMAMLFLNSGIRHTHEGGDEGHSHAVTRAGFERHAHHHSHAHGGHSHYHGDHPHEHCHSHFHGDDAYTHRNGGEVNSAKSHVHISFLWWELTLPDFFSGNDDVRPGSTTRTADTNTIAETSETIAINSPFTKAHLIQFIFLTPAPLLERTTIPADHIVGFVNLASLLKAGRLPDAPLLPPPEWV